MNREIKFRAWHKFANEMFYDKSADVFRWVDEGQPVEVMQFTGLKDKNGKEIFDGDIIACDGFDTVDVKWLEEAVGWFPFAYRFPAHNVMTTPSAYNVIGNIYQHPHLISSLTPKS